MDITHDIVKMIIESMANIRFVLSNKELCSAKYTFLPIPQQFSISEPIARVEIFNIRKKRIFVFDIWICIGSSEYVIETVASVPNDEHVHGIFEPFYGNKITKESTVQKIANAGRMTKELITVDFILKFYKMCYSGLKTKNQFIKGYDIKLCHYKIENLTHGMCRN